MYNKEDIQKKILTNDDNSWMILRAEQSRAEQSRAEQSRAEQSRAEQSRADNITYLLIYSDLRTH